MAPLDRALTLAEGQDRALPVGQELDLDMTRTLDVALAVDAVVAECGLGLSLRGVHRVPELGRVADDAHPAAAAARRGLDDEREADVVGLPGGQRRNPRLNRDPLRFELVAARAEGLGSRSDETKARRLDGLGESRVLRQEAVAGVDRVRTRLLRRANVLLGVEIARDLHGLVGVPGVEGAEIVRRSDRDRADSGFAARAEDARGDLAPVRYEELLNLHSTANVIRDAPESSR